MNHMISDILVRMGNLPEETVRRMAKKGLQEIGRSDIYQYLPDDHNNILMYHSVGGGGYDNISPELFETQLRWLQRTYEIVDLPDVLGQVGNKKIAITFDDALSSFYENVRPLLHKYSIPATVFVIGASVRDPPGYRYIRGERLMRRRQLEEIAADPLVTIGSHTMSHPPLSKIDDEEELHEEINEGTKQIEEVIDVSIDRFCYPFNDWSEAAHKIVREQHEYAVLEEGYDTFITERTDPHLLPRINGAVPMPVLKFEISDFRKYIG